MSHVEALCGLKGEIHHIMYLAVAHGGVTSRFIPMCVAKVSLMPQASFFLLFIGKRVNQPGCILRSQI